jgi:hypothetical protein
MKSKNRKGAGQSLLAADQSKASAAGGAGAAGDLSGHPITHGGALWSPAKLAPYASLSGTARNLIDLGFAQGAVLRRRSYAHSAIGVDRLDGLRDFSGFHFSSPSLHLSER